MFESRRQSRMLPEKPGCDECCSDEFLLEDISTVSMSSDSDFEHSHPAGIPPWFLGRLRCIAIP
jgi:hypothetical protein